MSTGVLSKTAGDLIRDSLRAATISGIELPISNSDFVQGQNALNDILANFQTKQIHLWSETEATIPMNIDQQKYKFGTDPAFTDYIYTTAIAANSGATVLDVLSTIGMTTGDNIGIELSTGVRQWLILTVVDANTVSLSAPLAAAVNTLASVYSYTVGIDQPVRILSIRFANNEGDVDITTNKISRDEYYNQTTKSTSGMVNTWYFSRQLNYGELNVWPVANNCRNILHITFIKPQYVPEDQSENILIPPEWYIALKWRLAADLALIYGVDANRQMIMEQKAAIYIGDAMGTDNEFSSFSFVPGK